MPFQDSIFDPRRYLRPRQDFTISYGSLPDAPSGPVSEPERLPYGPEESGGGYEESGGEPAPDMQEQTASPEVPQQAVPTAYQGQAFPGLPVIVDRDPRGGDTVTYNGRIVNSEADAFAARERDAADPRAREVFAQRERARAAVADPGDEQMEPTSIQIRQEMSRLQLSRADQLELTQLQNGISRVQADAREGRVPTAQAIQIQRQLRERMQPMVVSLQQLQGMRAALEYTVLNERVAQEAQARVRANAFWQANPAGSTRPIMDGDRQVGEQTVDLQGNVHHVMYPREPASAGGSGGTGGASGGSSNLAAAQTAVDRRVAAAPNEAERVRMGRPEVQQSMLVEEANRLASVQREVATLQPGGPVPFDQPDANATWGIGVRGLINDAVTRTNGRPAARVGGRLQPAVPAAPEINSELRAMAARLRTAGHSTGNLLANATPQERTRYEELLRSIGYYRREFTPEVDRELATFERRSDGSLLPANDSQGRAARGVRDVLGTFGSEAEALQAANNPALPEAVRRIAADFPHHLATLRLFRWGRTAEENAKSRQSRADGPARPNRPRQNVAPLSSSADVPL